MTKNPKQNVQWRSFGRNIAFGVATGRVDGHHQGGHLRATGAGEGVLWASAGPGAGRKKPLDTKALPQFGAGVLELRESFDRNAYRLMYVVTLKRAVYVLHAFNKKSKSGIGLSKPDADLIELRLKRAQALDVEE